ncbi:MAG: hypothetical protein ABII23_00855, partial [bacterium]
MKYVKKASIIFMLYCITSMYSPEVHAEFSRYRGIIHLQSIVSHGAFTLEKIVSEAQKRGIDIVIPTDTALKRIEYGVSPFRELLKKTAAFPSVLSLGPDVYLNEIKLCRNKFPDMVIIPGVEAIPFYYWEGNLWKKNLTLRKINKHMLIIGFEDAHMYTHMPVISNPQQYVWKMRFLWPLLPVICVKANKFDPYHGDQYGEKPYQMLIDYVTSKGGIIMWAHPDTLDYEKPRQVGPIYIKSNPYGEALINTQNYDGFAYFRQG